MRRVRAGLIPVLVIAMVASVLAHESATAPPAVADETPTLDCSWGLCINNGGVDFGGGTVKISDHVDGLHSIVRGLGANGARTRNAWAPLEARARAMIAATHGIPNDDRLLVGARNELRSVMAADLFNLIKKRASGGVLTAEETGILTELETLIKERRIQRATDALNEYDRWDTNPCTYQPPAGFGFEAYRNPICANPNPPPGSNAWDYPPDVDAFRIYGVGIESGRIIPDNSETRRVWGQTVKGIVALSVIAAAGIYAAIVTALILASPALAFAIATAISGAIAAFVSLSATGAVVATGGSIAAAAWGSALVGTVSSVAVGAVVGVIAIAVIGAVLVGIRIWQLVETTSIRPALVEDLNNAQNGSVNLAELATSSEGNTELFSTFLAQTLPETQQDAYDVSTPANWTQDKDPFLRVQNSAHGLIGDQQSVRLKSYNADTTSTPSTESYSVVDGWFVRQPDGGSREWSLGMRYVDWDGKKMKAELAPDGEFVTSPDAKLENAPPDTNAVKTSELKVTLADGTRAYLSRVGNQKPNVVAKLSGTLKEGDQIRFDANASDPDGDPVTVRWAVQPAYNLVGVICGVGPCNPGTGWDTFTGTTAYYTPLNDGSYQGTVTVTDSHGSSTTQSFEYTVADVEPVLLPTVSPSAITQGNSVTLSGSWNDRGDDPYVLTVDWGDGSAPSTATNNPCAPAFCLDPPNSTTDPWSGVTHRSWLTQAQRNSTPFSLTHTYANDPAGTNNNYTITLSLTPLPTGPQSPVTTVTRAITVTDPPATATINPTTGTYFQGDVVHATGTVHTNDPFTVEVNWSDGTITNDSFACAGPSCPYDVTHVYHTAPSNGGPNFGDTLVSVTVRDDDNRPLFGQSTIHINAVPPTVEFNPTPQCPPDNSCDADVIDVLPGVPVLLRGRVTQTVAGEVLDTVTVTWGDGKSENVTLGSPPWLNSGCGIGCSWAPYFRVEHAYAAAGNYTVRVTAKNKDLTSSSATTVVHVLPSSAPDNAAPTASSAAVSTLEDRPLDFDLRLLAADAETADADLTFRVVTQPVHGTVQINGHTATYTPNYNFADFTVPDVFTFEVKDRGKPDGCTPVSATCAGPKTAEGHLGVLVVPHNDPPTAGADEVTIAEDTAVVATAPETGLLANDSDPDGEDITVVGWTQPEHGQVTFVGAQGTFGLVPETNFVGDTTFQYTIQDERGGVATANVTVHVTPTNDHPSPQEDSYFATRGTPLVVPAAGVLANDVDIDGDSLFVSSASASPVGTLDMNEDGSFTFTPKPSFIGDTTFTYIANDGRGGFAEATVHVHVGGDTIWPTATLNEATTQADPTSTNPIHFTVTFSEPITGFDASDLFLLGTGNPVNPVVTEIAPNDGTTFDVAVTATTPGSVTAFLPGAKVVDLDGNPNSPATGANNTVTFVSAATVAPKVSSSVLPTSVKAPFTLTFDRSVKGITTKTVFVTDVTTNKIERMKLACLGSPGGAAVSCTKGPVRQVVLTHKNDLKHGRPYRVSATAGVLGIPDGLALTPFEDTWPTPHEVSVFDPSVSFEWPTVKNNGALGRSYVQEQNAGAKQSFTATGDSVGIITWSGPDGGTARVDITTPGQPTVSTDIDTYAESFGGVTHTIGGLPAGTHTVTITVTGAGSGSTSGTWVRIDGVVIAGKAKATPKLFGATWPNASADYAFTRTPGSAATFSFTGVEAYVTWLDDGLAGGYYAAELDGKPVTPSGSFDAGDGFVAYRYRATKAGKHTLTITHIGDQPWMTLAIRNFGVF